MASSVTATTYPSARNDATESLLEEWIFPAMPNGVIWTVGNQLAVFADSTGMHVKLPSGATIIGGVRGKLTTQTTLDVATAHATLNRIDSVVAHLDRTSPYTITYKVVTGTASGSPAAPTLVNTSTITEILIANIAVNAAVSTINAGNVSLQRSFTGDTGWFDWGPPTFTASAGSDFVISGQIPGIARGRHRGMSTEILVQAQVAVDLGTPDGAIVCPLPWPAKYGGAPMNCIIQGTAYIQTFIAKTFTVSGQNAQASINAIKGDAFINDGVARPLYLSGTFELLPF